MKPLFIAGTSQNVGKTTTSLGLLHAFRKRGLRVAFSKPLGQRIREKGEHALHEDVALVSRSLGMRDEAQADMVLPLPKGAVGKAVHDLHAEESLARTREAFETLAEGVDVVVTEGAGHVGVGSCLKTSAADLARTIGAKVLLVAGGGVGSTIDSLSLSWDFLRYRGAEVLGVVVTKIWPQKYTHIQQTVTCGLSNLDIPCFGAIPFEDRLSQPTVRQVHEFIGGELMGGQDALDQHVENTIVAAMEPNHMIRYLTPGTLVITPGDRTDNLLAALSAHILADVGERLIAGVILTGGFRPDAATMDMVRRSNLPTILVKEDTYSAGSKFHEAVFKIALGDREKIEWAVCLVEEYVDVDGIIAGLQ